MWSDTKAIYSSAWTFAFACPILFLIPALLEMAQHVVEMKIGMYQSWASAKAVEHSNWRSIFGTIKELSLLLPGYWFIRYLGYGNNAEHARQIDLRAFGLWLVIFIISAFLSAWSLFGPSVGSMLALTGKAAVIAAIALAGVQLVIGIYLTAWVVAWPLGNGAIGPIKSSKIMLGYFWRAFAYYVTGMLPLLVLHYALGLGAIGRPEWLVWPMMIIDALVTAMLALTLTGNMWFAARYAARAKGVSLLPSSYFS